MQRFLECIFIHLYRFHYLSFWFGEFTQFVQPYFEHSDLKVHNYRKDDCCKMDLTLSRIFINSTDLLILNLQELLHLNFDFFESYLSFKH